MSSRNAAINAIHFQIRYSAADSFFWRTVQLCERIVAGILLVLAAPALFAGGLLLMVLSRRSPLIAHKRVGKSGSAIWILKLRTMWDDRPSQNGHFIERISDNTSAELTPKATTDARVKSRFAALCRRFSLDEMPQLWQVVRGEMCLIGPRPLTTQEIARYYGPDALELLSRRPGISGLWQVRGRSSLNYKQRRRLDLFLIRRWCFPLYLKILIATIPSVIRGKNAW